MLFFLNNFFCFWNVMIRWRKWKMYLDFRNIDAKFQQKILKTYKDIRVWSSERLLLTNKNSLFGTSNPKIFLSFQNFLLKFGMHVPDIKIHFLFSSCYHKFSKTKKWFRRKKQFFTLFLIFCNYRPTWSPDDFFIFYWIFLKFGMLVSLIAFYFFYFQCCYQLSKAKKLLKKKHVFLGS